MLSIKKRAVFAVLAAALAGGAGAQSCVMAGGEPLRTSEGSCVRTGTWTAAFMPPAPKSVAYSTEVLFAFDDDVLTADARRQLDQLAQRLVAMDLDRAVAVGYADGIGPAGYNKRLSARRAKAVGDYLAGKGVPAERLQLVAMGQDSPQPERRVTVEMTGREKVGR